MVFWKPSFVTLGKFLKSPVGAVPPQNLAGPAQEEEDEAQLQPPRGEPRRVDHGISSSILVPAQHQVGHTHTHTPKKKKSLGVRLSGRLKKNTHTPFTPTGISSSSSSNRLRVNSNSSSSSSSITRSARASRSRASSNSHRQGRPAPSQAAWGAGNELYINLQFATSWKYSFDCTLILLLLLLPPSLSVQLWHPSVSARLPPPVALPPQGERLHPVAVLKVPLQMPQRSVPRPSEFDTFAPTTNGGTQKGKKKNKMEDVLRCRTRFCTLLGADLLRCQRVRRCWLGCVA